MQTKFTYKKLAVLGECNLPPHSVPIAYATITQYA